MERYGRVLVVGDTATERARTLRRLREHGYEPAEVASAEAALDAARERVPDAVLLDVDLSESDAFDILLELRSDPVLSEVPVVAVTMHREVDFAARILVAGAHDYLRKPVDEVELIARVAAAVRAKELHDELRSHRTALAAGLDEISGVLDRAALEEELGRQVARARRHDRPLSVLLVDIDGFSEVNDRQGRQFGDRLLAACAQRLRQRARAADVVGRWDADRFMVVAPDIDYGGAALLAGAVRAAITRPSMVLAGRPIGVTASVGWAEWGGEECEHLLARCSGSLADAKAAGRDASRGAP